MISAAWTLAAALAASPCELPATPAQAAAGTDVTAAEAYRQVGEEELARGQTATARDAFAEALRRAPSNAAAHDGLTRACAPTVAERLEQASSALDRGDPRGALALLEKVPADARGPSVALLEGVCLYQLGEVARARPLFEQARTDPDYADSAELYLGLLALEDGRKSEAAARFGRLAERPGLISPSLAAELASLSSGAPRVALQLGLAAGFDSNVLQLPESVASTGAGADAGLGVEGALVLHPWGENGAFAQLSGSYRRRAALTDYDLGFAGAELGAWFGSDLARAKVSYEAAFLSLGAAPYLFGQRLGAAAQLPAGRLSFEPAISAGWDAFLEPVAASYTGPRVEGEGWVFYTFQSGTRFGGGYLASRELASTDARSSLAHGPAVEAQLRLAERTWLVLRATAESRQFDSFDPALGLARSDLGASGFARLEVPLAAHWVGSLSVEGRAVDSNAPVFTQQGWGAGVGFGYRGAWW